MTIIYQAEDTIEPASDTMMEQFGNIANYNVVSGCAVTYDAADMTVDIASGVITHNGSRVTVAGGSNALTLSADGSNPRWSWICLSSAGAAVLVSGTAAADPTVPELGDRVALALVKIEAAQTVANSITYKLDKRLFTPGEAGVVKVTAAGDQTATTVTLANNSELVAGLLASTWYLFEAEILYNGPAAGDIKIAFTVPAGADVTWQGWGFNSTFSSTPELQGANGSGTALIFGANGTAVPVSVKIHGAVVVAGTAGSLTLQMAQGTASGTTTLKAKSWLKVY